MSVWVELAIKQSKLFIEDNVTYCNCLVTCDSMRTLWRASYNYLVNLKRLTSIETLPLNEKQTIWETAKEIASGRLNEKKVIELCKALYCLEYILNLKEWNGTPIN